VGVCEEDAVALALEVCVDDCDLEDVWFEVALAD